MIRFSTDAARDAYAWCMGNIITFHTEYLDEYDAQTLQETVESMASDQIQEPRNRESKPWLYKPRILSELLRENLTATVLHEMTHDVLGGEITPIDYGDNTDKNLQLRI